MAPKSPRKVRKVWRRLIVPSMAVLVAGGLAPLPAAPAAPAAVAVVGGSCGFHVGPPFQMGAMGTAAFEFPIYPAEPHQVCQVTVTTQASLRPAAGGSYTDVTGGSPVSLTLDFTGGPLPLGITWLWQPDCADPPAPGLFTVTVDGQSSSKALSTMQSCFPDLGDRSSLGFDSAIGAEPDPYTAVAMAATTDGLGYWTLEATGAASARGDATTPAMFGGILNQPMVGMATDPTGRGYWAVAADGGVFSFGGASFHGSMGGARLDAPVVGMAATPEGGGYWLVAADGGVFGFGDAGFYGSAADLSLAAPVVGMAATPEGGGYWLVAADGGVFSFGDGGFYGAALVGANG